MDNNKEYYAFISYKSEDVEWAIWLQHELEHYHLPASFNGRTDIRQELRPVFRDIDELSAGNLPEQIKRALENSQNLIVVCSPQAAASPWVNQEVETFISLGRTDRIFPFIVEGNSPKEFFPPALLALPKNEERLGGDAAKQDRDIAFVKVVAGMLGLGFDSLWNRYEKEKAEEERKKREEKEINTRILINSAAEKAGLLYRESLSVRVRLQEMNLEQIIKGHRFETETEEAFRLVTLFMNNSKELSNKKVAYAVFSPNKQKIASIIRFGQIHVWDVSSGRLVNVLSIGDYSPLGVAANLAVNNQGTLISSILDSHRICVWDCLEMRLKYVFENKDCDFVFSYFTSDDKVLVVVSSTDTIIAYDMISLKTIKLHCYE